MPSDESQTSGVSYHKSERDAGNAFPRFVVSAGARDIVNINLLFYLPRQFSYKVECKIRTLGAVLMSVRFRFSP